MLFKLCLSEVVHLAVLGELHSTDSNGVKFYASQADPVSIYLSLISLAQPRAV